MAIAAVAEMAEPVCEASRLSGSVTVRDIPQVQRILRDAWDQDAPIELDCQDVEYFDAAVLQLLLVAQRELQTQGRTLTLGNLSPVLSHSLQRNGFSRLSSP